MTCENYVKMREYNVTLAESFYKAELSAEIMEILSENEGVGMTAKDIAEFFNEKFAHKITSWKNVSYYHITKGTVAQLLVKLVDMGKVKVVDIVEYPVTITVNYLGEIRKATFDGWSKVYGL